MVPLLSAATGFSAEEDGWMTEVGHDVATGLGGQYRSKRCEDVSDWDQGEHAYVYTYDVGVDWVPMAYIMGGPTWNYGRQYWSYGE